jgi:hypothetical protein
MIYKGMKRPIQGVNKALRSVIVAGFSTVEGFEIWSNVVKGSKKTIREKERHL